MPNEFLDKIVSHWKALDAVRAVGLIGSAATGDPQAADVDLAAFVDQVPDEPTRRSLWEAPGSPIDADAVIYGANGDRVTLDGKVMELDYFSIPDLTRRIDKVIVEGDTTPAFVVWCTPAHVPEAVCADIQACRILWDPEDLIKHWKESVAEYPEKFRLKLLRFVLFEMRFKLKNMRRAAQLRNIPFFHMALSDLCFCLLRMLYSLNRVYFTQAKRAMGRLAEFPILPTDCRRRIEALVRSPLSEENLNDLFAAAKRLVQETADLASQQGESEKTAIAFGLADWPDVEPLS